MWKKLCKLFKDSEVILIARLHTLGGIALETLQQTDPQLFANIIPSRWLGVYLFGFGIFLEYARRRRDQGMD